MSVLDSFARKYGRYIPENITKVLLIGQVVSYIVVYVHPEYASYFFLSGRELLQGQIWRLVTIIFAPVSDSLLFVILAWYFFYLLGTALENQWGSFRYLVYIFTAYSATIIFTLLFPNFSVSNKYMYVSLFLAFTYLYPNFQVLLFFIIPIKVKWLGYLAWLSLIIPFIAGPLSVKILILFSVSNFFFFFYKDLRYTLLALYRGVSSHPKGVQQSKKPLHVCAVCGCNELDQPDMEIRYCRQCSPTTCYCGDHIKRHQHVRPVN